MLVQMCINIEIDQLNPLHKVVSVYDHNNEVCAQLNAGTGGACWISVQYNSIMYVLEGTSQKFLDL